MALVLCTGSDRTLMESRRMILERGGHHVVTAMSASEIEEGCRKNEFEVAVVGQRMTAEDKRRIAATIRQHCPTAKILELHPLMTAATLHDADSWLQVPAELPIQLADRVTELAAQRDPEQRNAAKTKMAKRMR